MMAARTTPEVYPHHSGGSRRRGAIAVGVVAVLVAAAAACGGGSSGGSIVAPARRPSRCPTATPTSRRRRSRHRSPSGTRPNPTQTVKLEFNGGNDGALQKTIAGFTAGNYPDAAYEYGSSAAQLAKQPKLVNLTDKVNSPSMDWDDFYPSERQAATVNGQGRGDPRPGRQPGTGLQQGAVQGGRRCVAERHLDVAAVPDRGQGAHQPGHQDLRLGLHQRRQRGHRLALPRDVVASRRSAAQQRQHQARLRLPGRAGRTDSAAQHGRRRQVGLPRHRQRRLPQRVQQRQDRDAVDRPVGPVQHQLQHQLRRHAAARLQR